MLLVGLATPAAARGPTYVTVQVTVKRISKSPEPVSGMALDVTGAPLERSGGVMARDEVIAQHTVRAREAVILDTPVKGRRREVPVGAALAKVVFDDGGQTTVLWCDLAVIPHEPGSGFYDCLSDSSGSGHFDRLWRGVASEQFLGFGEHDIRAMGALPAAVDYHVARPEERPTGKVGYAWCAGDGVKSPPRFEVSGEMMGRYWDAPESHPCALGQWADATHTAVDVDGLRIAVRSGPDAKHLEFSVTGRIAPAPLAHLDAGGAIRTVSAAETEAQSELAATGEGALVPTGATASAAAGEVESGADLFDVQVRYALTGVLKNDIYQGALGFFGRAPSAEAPRMTAGQPLYAQRVSGVLTPQVVWCAPRKDAAGGFKDAVCFPHDGAGHMWVESGLPMMGAMNLEIPANSRAYVSAPSVEARPVAFPPMSLKYRFEGADSRGLKVQVLLDWGQGERLIRTVAEPWGAGREASLPVPGGVVQISPGADGGHVEARFRQG
jgi:hypothetical protein